MKGTADGERPWRWIVLLFVGLLVMGGTAGRKVARAQLDLSVFYKEGASEEAQSRDRYECHRAAVQATGFDPTVREGRDETLEPRTTRERREEKAERDVDRWKKLSAYTQVVESCMKERGYTIREH